MTPAITLFIDADACPVKDEVYKVAERYQIKTYVVANSFIRVPREDFVQAIIVENGLNIADDWIAERAHEAAIVITNDVPLADRVVKAGGVAIKPNGHIYDERTIGNALATRNLMESLREGGMMGGGPPPFSAKDRSQFLSSLDLSIQRLKRRGFTP